MGRLRWWWVGSVVLVPLMVDCGHSEDEWQARLRESDDLKTRLDTEQAQARKARADLDESTARIEQLKTAGVDVSNLNANLEMQARALEEYRRHGEQVDASRRRLELLRAKLAPFAKQGVTVTVRNNRLVVQLAGDALFDSGRETLRREGRDLVLKVAEVIRSDPSLSARAFQVAGHVDAAPAGGRFKDGFGFSVMRAREVLAVLLQPADKGGGGLNPSRWSAAGYGEVDPVKSNETPEGKQANRRIEIVILPAVEEVLDLKPLVQ